MKDKAQEQVPRTKPEILTRPQLGAHIKKPKSIMAVDYLHRLIVAGPFERVRTVRRQLHRESTRTISGRSWTEVVPFSFEALYELAPAARRAQREIPSDPYELSRWPLRRLGGNRAEVRYQFQTRNLEMIALLRPLSRALPALSFTLVTPLP